VTPQVRAPLRLGTFNLLSGRSLLDGRADPERLRAAVASLDVDVLALQEVDRHQPRSGGVDQAALAAAVMGADYLRFVDTVHGTPGVDGWSPTREGPEPPDGPSYGVALVSRLPVESWHVLRLGSARGRYPLLAPTRPPSFMWLPDEPRVALAGVLAEPRMTVVCTHLSFVPMVNVRQLRRLVAWAGALPAPRVLLGDLNLPGRLPGRITGWTSVLSSPTFPAPAPRVQLDHVLLSGLPDGSRASARTQALPISDHRAVVAHLHLP
jgi:endonuclease/exonuclease/phosphatase family metal-dependent hydrolase